MPEDKHEQLFLEVDVDNDGSISMTEMVDFLRDFHEDLFGNWAGSSDKEVNHRRHVL